ncbi:hypothetical protein [[Eubacterium] cellulosolvens]
MTTSNTSTKLLVVALTLVLLSVTITSNLQYAAAANLTNDSMRPEKNQYWKRQNKDLDDGWMFEYTIEVVDETTISVGNKNVPVLVLEGTGKILDWPDDIITSQRTEDNDIYIKKEINKNNLELITYTLNMSYRYVDGEGNYTENYVYVFETYDIIELTKPDNITVGTNWTKKVILTQVFRFKKGNKDVEEYKMDPVMINSTIECDRIEKVTVPGGEFDTFRVVEQQFVISAFPDKTIFWYLSLAAKDYVKMERWNAQSIVEESEELLEFGKKTDGNGLNNNDSNDNDEPGWLDLGNRNTQLLLGILGLVIICLVIGVIVYRKRKKQS